MVGDSPPVYYPKGLTADAPTAYKDGCWIYARDDADTRFFIPLGGHGGIGQQQLIDEARAATGPVERKRLERETLVKRTVFWGLFPSFLLAHGP